MTPTDLQSIIARAQEQKRLWEGTTQGEWNIDCPRVFYRIKAGDIFIMEKSEVRDRKDAAWIAAAHEAKLHEDVIRLAKEVERLTKERDDTVNAAIERERTRFDGY